MFCDTSTFPSKSRPSFLTRNSVATFSEVLERPSRYAVRISTISIHLLELNPQIFSFRRRFWTRFSVDAHVERLAAKPILTRNESQFVQFGQHIVEFTLSPSDESTQIQSFVQRIEHDERPNGRTDASLQLRRIFYRSKSL